MVIAMLNDVEFLKIFSLTINEIAKTIEEQDENHDMDVDINGDVLTITTENGVYVINKQQPLRELWLSSPISGPYHFSYDAPKWRSKMGDYLGEILTRELRIGFAFG